eukprot:scaffold776_cov347-Pavlova_lutheri.AAC.124
MELHGSDVIQVAKQGKQAASKFVVPDFDLIIVSTRHEQRLGSMKVDPPHRAIVLVESIDERSHAVVPQLDHSTVQACEDPWSPWMKAAANEIDFASVPWAFQVGCCWNGRGRTSGTSVASLRTPSLSHDSTWSRT